MIIHCANMCGCIKAHKYAINYKFLNHRSIINKTMSCAFQGWYDQTNPKKGFNTFKISSFMWLPRSKSSKSKYMSYNQHQIKNIIKNMLIWKKKPLIHEITCNLHKMHTYVISPQITWKFMLYIDIQHMFMVVKIASNDNQYLQN
jgi:hypothetical protein